MIGLDWIACALTLTGLWMLGNKNRKAFLVSIVANCFWIAYVLTAATLCIPLLVVNAAILGLNVRAYWQWGRELARKPTDEEEDQWEFEFRLRDRLDYLNIAYKGNVPLPAVE